MIKLAKKTLNLAIPLIDLFWLGLLGYSFLYALIQIDVVNNLLVLLSGTFNALPNIVQWSLIVSCGYTLPWFLQKHKTYHVNHSLKNDLKKPPVYLASFLTFFAAICLNENLRALITLETIGQFTIGAMIYSLYLRYKTLKNDTSTGADNEEFNIKTWLEKETPIENKNYDMLNLNTYATRIENLLLESSKSHQIAIRGDFGTGKSSLCRIIDDNLKARKKKNFIFCYIDGWGRENRSIAGQVLEIIVDKLSEFVDCSSLTQVPENYINALNGTGINNVIALTHLFSANDKTNPEHHLKKIDDLLIKIDSHLVAVVEDFDRDSEVEKTTNELAALLERLKSLKNINFILCIKGDQPTIVDKVCTHIEDILPISYEAIQKIITEFMGLIEAECAGEIYLPPKKHEYTFIEPIAPLIKTPRNLKKILRRTRSAWENIKGEVYFYDLLHINILRFSNLEMYSFLTSEMENLKNAKNRGDTEKLLIAKSETLNISTEEKVALVAVTLTFFMGSLFGDSTVALEIKIKLMGYSVLAENAENKNQQTKYDSIYMRQAIAEAIDKDSPSDKYILSAIHSKNPTEKLLKKLIAQESEHNYKAHLSRARKWLLNKKDCNNSIIMTQIINKELSRLQTPKTSTGYEHYANKLIKNKNIYPLQEEIIEILRKTISLKNDSQLAALPIEIIKHLIATNSSMALETISFAATQKNNENLTVWPEIRETFFDLLSDEINSDIFKSVDPTDTRFLFNFFDQYNMNQKNDRVSVEIISSFHKLAFEHGLKLEKPLIPMIIYHIEKSLIPPNYNFESAWDINLLKEIILSFESVDLTIYQHQDELQGYLEKWKNLAKNNQPPLYQ